LHSKNKSLCSAREITLVILEESSRVFRAFRITLSATFEGDQNIANASATVAHQVTMIVTSTELIREETLLTAIVKRGSAIFTR